jgi:hypothetical protein
VTSFYQNIGHEIPSTAESTLRLELVNKSRIVALGLGKSKPFEVWQTSLS